MIEKRFFSLFLALLMVVSSLPLAAIPVQAATNVNLTVWMDSPAIGWLQEQVEEFNAQSSKWNITLEAVVACHVGDAGNMVAADPQNAGDIFIYASDGLGTLCNAGALLPITGSALSQVKKDNSTSMLNSVTHSDGNIYGIPYSSNTWFMYYDKSVFSESDIKSLDTMLKKGKVSFPVTNSWYLASFFFANGCTMFGSKGIHAAYGIDFGGEEGLEATEYIIDLVNDPNFVNYGVMLNNAWEAFGMGADVAFSGTWEYSTLLEMLGNDLGIAPLPTVKIDGEVKQLKAFAGSRALGVNAHTKYPEAAMALAAFLGNQDSQLERYELFNEVPSCPDLLDDLGDDPLVHTQLTTIANTSVVQPSIPEMAMYWGPAGNLGWWLVDGSLNKDSLADTLHDFVQQMNGGIVITEQPESETKENGEKFSVAVRAKGNDLTYQWYIKNAGSSKFSKSSVSKSTYSGTMTEKVHGRQIYCIITDANGTRLRTKTVTLSMEGQEEPVKITQQPKGTAVSSGKTAKVTVKAAGEDLKYTWYVKDPGASKFSKSSITKSTYSVTMKKARSGRQVYCVITDKFGNKVKSDVVTISQITISSQPKGDSAASKKTVSATVKASGDGLKYQWYIRDAGKTAFSKSSIKKSSYSFTMTSARSGREAYCVITDKYGNSVATETITFSRLYIKTQPKGVSVASGKTAKVTVTAVGENLQYTWYVKDPGKDAFSRSSVATSSYSIKMTSARSGRQVYCVVKDRYGNTVKTEIVTLKRK